MEKRCLGTFKETIRGKEIEVTVNIIKDPETVRRAYLDLIAAVDDRITRKQLHKTSSG